MALVVGDHIVPIQFGKMLKKRPRIYSKNYLRTRGLRPRHCCNDES